MATDGVGVLVGVNADDDVTEYGLVHVVCPPQMLPA
jgi:hypothetical protein